MNKLSKYATDCKHVRSVTAVALIRDGEVKGKVIANWSDNPAGTVCTATVWCEVNGTWFCGTGTAGGYGYDKLSAAIYDAFRRGGHSDILKGHSGGDGRQEQVFSELGYKYEALI